MQVQRTWGRPACMKAAAWCRSALPLNSAGPGGLPPFRRAVASAAGRGGDDTNTGEDTGGSTDGEGPGGPHRHGACLIMRPPIPPADAVQPVLDELVEMVREHLLEPVPAPPPLPPCPLPSSSSSSPPSSSPPPSPPSSSPPPSPPSSSSPPSSPRLHPAAQPSEPIPAQHVGVVDDRHHLYRQLHGESFAVAQAAEAGGST
jgi:hypothetical protein